MKDDGPKVFKLVKANSALDFIKNNTSLTSASEGIIFDKIHGIVFLTTTKILACEYNSDIAL